MGAARRLRLPASARGAACRGAALAPRALTGTRPRARLGWLRAAVAGAIPRSVTAKARGVVPLLKSSSRDDAMPLWDGEAPGEHCQAVTRPLLHLPRPRPGHRPRRSPLAAPVLLACRPKRPRVCLAVLPPAQLGPAPRAPQHPRCWQLTDRGAVPGPSKRCRLFSFFLCNCVKGGKKAMGSSPVSNGEMGRSDTSPSTAGPKK